MLNKVNRYPRCPMMGVAIFFVLGISFSVLLPAVTWTGLLTGIFLCMCGALRFINQRGRRHELFIFCMFFFLGALHVKSSAFLPTDHIVYRPVQAITGVKGTIVSDVVHKKSLATKAVFTLALREVYRYERWEVARGKIQVNMFNRTELRYGDTVELEGKLHYPFDFSTSPHFSYPRYLRYQGVTYICSIKKNGRVQILARGKGNPVTAGIMALRLRFSRILDRYLSVGESGIMKAVLLGERSFIPSEINELFTRTGTVHILAISGMNVGFVVVLFMLLVSFFPLYRREKLVLCLIFIWIYAILTGAEASVVRAAIMATIVTAGYLLHRVPDSWNCVAVAAFVILVVNPLTLLDIGFQLSFICIMGILAGIRMMGLEDRLPDQFGWKRISDALGYSFLVSLSAWVASAALIAYYFESVTPVSLLANLIVIPLFSLVIALGSGLLLVGGWPWLAYPFAACLKLTLNLSALSLYFFEMIPYGHLLVPQFRLEHLLFYYSMLLCVCFWKLWSKTAVTRRKLN